MTGSTDVPPDATASVEVRASAATTYALISDLGTLADVAEETESMVWLTGTMAEPGAVFTGRNRNGSKTWSTRCTVTDAEPGRRFGFEVTAGPRWLPLPIARWRYDVEPLPGDVDAERCRVTESTWDQRPAWFKRPGGWLTGVPDRATASQQHIEATLARVRQRLSA